MEKLRLTVDALRVVTFEPQAAFEVDALESTDTRRPLCTAFQCPVTR